MKDLIEKAESILSGPVLKDLKWFIRGAYSQPSFICNLEIKIEDGVVRAYYDWIDQGEKVPVRTWIGRVHDPRIEETWKELQKSAELA